MSPQGDWLEQLEARLEQQLEAFLRANPAQEALLKEQDHQEQRQAQRQQQSTRIQQSAALRTELLQIAADIRQWRDRAQRARDAGAQELAQRAEQQVAARMEQGRQRWHSLEQLGQTMQADHTATAEQTSAAKNPVDQDWERFEVEQELEALRRRQRPSS